MDYAGSGVLGKLTRSPQAPTFVVIYRNLQGEHTDAQFADQYRSIEFKDENRLRLLDHYHARMSKAALRAFPEQAVKEMLALIELVEQRG